MSKNIFSVKGEKTYLNDREFLVKGLRCSNALYSEKSTMQLIRMLDMYADYGLNTISVFIMGNRFSDFSGYNQDATLNTVYADRLGRIIEAADDKGMVVLVGCLYWGETKGKWESWSQKEANEAVMNSIKWLKGNDYRNVFIDVDNEGMGRGNAGFDNRELVIAAKSVDPSYMIGTNYIGQPPQEADLCLHFSNKVSGKPYIESEGVPENAPGGYWWKFSRKEDPDNPYIHSKYNNYINIGVYTDEMKVEQINRTRLYLDNGYGYLMASTWLQALPPFGPNYCPGGYGSPADPGIRWWLEFIKENYGPYIPLG